MKTLLTLLIAGLFITVQAQVYFDRSNGFFVADSLYQDYPDLTAESPIDSTNQSDIIVLNFYYDWLNITAIDTGTVYDDSCVVEYPLYDYERDITKPRLTYKVTDTTWQKVQFMRDSSWTNVNGSFIVDDNSTKSYTIFVGDYESIRIRMTNEEIVAGRVWKYKLSASMKK